MLTGPRSNKDDRLRNEGHSLSNQAIERLVYSTVVSNWAFSRTSGAIKIGRRCIIRLFNGLPSTISDSVFLSSATVNRSAQLPHATLLFFLNTLNRRNKKRRMSRRGASKKARPHYQFETRTRTTRSCLISNAPPGPSVHF